MKHKQSIAKVIALEKSAFILMGSLEGHSIYRLR